MQVKNVPEDVHRTLRARAGEAGQSLQEYLLTMLIENARSESLEAVLARADGRSGGSLTLSFAAQTLRAERDDR